jgi:UDP-glucose 4-epimerase
MAKLRVLVTGSEGFIGKVICQNLEEAGHEVWGLDRTCSTAPNRRQADLLDGGQVDRAIASIPPCDAVIHAAAVAHEEKLPGGQTRVDVNTATTNKLLHALKGGDPHFIFLSSVAVYGEAGRSGTVFADASLHPSSDYGRSKQLCEQSILATAFSRCDILRCTPVFDESHLKDLRKRVCLPGLKKLKMRFSPAPRYSLCHVKTLAKTILEILEHPIAGRRVRNVADARPYGQHELLEWFPGRAWPLPILLFEPFYALAFLLPPGLGYKIRCLYCKLFRSNVYDVDHIEKV